MSWPLSRDSRCLPFLQVLAFCIRGGFQIRYWFICPQSTFVRRLVDPAQTLLHRVLLRRVTCDWVRMYWAGWASWSWRSWGYPMWLYRMNPTWNFWLFVPFHDFDLRVVKLIDEQVEGIDVVVFVCMGRNVLSVDLNPTIWLRMPKTFCSQEDMRSSRRLLVLILIRFTFERYLNEIISKIKCKERNDLNISASSLI